MFSKLNIFPKVKHEWYDLANVRGTDMVIRIGNELIKILEHETITVSMIEQKKAQLEEELAKVNADLEKAKELNNGLL